MENGQHEKDSIMDDSLMLPLDEKEQARSPRDVTIRRLKNRERQRRYRARKRLEADTKNACIINQSTPQLVEMQVNDTPEDCMTRIHCQRDWKKDARRAHLLEKQEVKFNDPVIPDPTLPTASQAATLPSGVTVERPLNSGCHSSSPGLDNSETRRLTPSRRHWKAEARNKHG